MKAPYNKDVVLNEFNEIDVDYYIAKGYELRSAAIREHATKLTDWIKKGFSVAIPKTA